MRYLATIALATLTGLPLTAQHQHSHAQCGTDYYYQQQIQQNPQIHQERQAADDQWMEHRDTYTYGTEVVQTIPVVVHVMYYNYEDSISVAQIEDAIDVLNEDFSRTNSDAGNVRSLFQGRQADMEIQFELAKKDPSGRATNGITYQQSDRSLGANDQIKGEINWPNTQYLNVWVVRAIDLGLPPSQGTILGYAAFPYNNQPVTDDGVVIRHDQMGRIGSAVSNGRTLTHEVGHFLNLYHPFQGGCTGVGDAISDTPPIASPSYGCNFNRNTCNTGANDEPDMIENFMDYTNDVCVNSFTTGQKSRAKDAMNSSFHPAWRRGMLNSPANHLATGINGTTVLAAPYTKFTVNEHTVCEGSSLEFEFLGASHDANTTYAWTFTGAGQTINASGPNPTVTFNDAGIYNVTLTVTNSTGSQTKSKPGYISVYNNTPYWDNRFTATFENDIPNSNWLIFDNGDGRTWTTSSIASFGGAKSAIMPEFQSRASGGDDLLQSAPILLDETSQATLRFRYAWARRENANQDRLTVLVSDDCGASWNIARLISSFQLNTAGPNVTGSFVPNNSQWSEVSIDLGAYIGPEPILLRFAFTGDGGNNLYIDEIRMDVTISVDENEINGFNVYPNPANDVLSIELTNADKAEWSLVNTTGQTVLNGSTTGVETTIDVSTLSSGMYILQVRTENALSTEKVIIE